MHGRFAVVLAFLAALTGGCDDTPPADPPAPPPVAIGTRFDAATAGGVRGHVVWEGPLPEVPPFSFWRVPTDPPGYPTRQPNPNAPVIDDTLHALAGAVVSLRGIDPQRGRPWDHPPVRVVLRDYRIDVEQGGPRRVGFVRRGEAVEMVSEQSVFHSLRANGVAYWTLAFPDVGVPATRRFSESGLVELTSGAGHFWMRGHLLVVDHPYYTTTDERGNFTLTGVPPGEYELACWLPDWRVVGHDRDPETLRLTRLRFGPPLERSRKVKVEPGAKTTATLGVGAASIAP